MKLQLKFSEKLQGEFQINQLNLLLAFQGNCPGCFLYALPMAQKLYVEKELNIVALSTAFEDFELNTVQNTRLLLKHKELVGETRKALAQYGFQKYPEPLDFPVLFDELLSREKFLNEKFFDELTNSFQPQSKKEQNQAEIKHYFSPYEKIPFTFTVNRFGGTPTWVIFDENYQILAQWFGHKSLEETKWIIESVKK